MFSYIIFLHQKSRNLFLMKNQKLQLVINEKSKLHKTGNLLLMKNQSYIRPCQSIGFKTKNQQARGQASTSCHREQNHQIEETRSIIPKNKNKHTRGQDRTQNT